VCVINFNKLNSILTHLRYHHHHIISHSLYMTTKETIFGTEKFQTKTPLKMFKFIQNSSSSRSIFRQFFISLQLLMFIRKQRKILQLLLDVHGHQIFCNGCFNGDPHPGNILHLDDGRIGLIDYGQCKTLNSYERLGISRIVYSLASSDEEDYSKVTNAMKEFGFRFKYGNEDIMKQMAALFFDSDVAGKKMGYATPQDYLSYLRSQDPLEHVPDAAGMFILKFSCSRLVESNMIAIDSSNTSPSYLF